MALILNTCSYSDEEGKNDNSCDDDEDPGELGLHSSFHGLTMVVLPVPSNRKLKTPVMFMQKCPCSTSRFSMSSGVLCFGKRKTFSLFVFHAR